MRFGPRTPGLSSIPQSAQRLSDAVLGATYALRHTNSGRLGRVPGTYEKLLRRQKYIILFEIDGGELRILRLVHTARHWPEGQPPPD